MSSHCIHHGFLICTENTDFNEHSFVSTDLVVFLLEKKNEIWQAYRQRQTLRHDNTVSGGRCGHERVIVGFTTTYVISAYKHWCYEFEFHSGRSVHHYVIVCQWLAAGQWFSPGTPVPSTNKTNHNNITEILLKVALNTININQTKPTYSYFNFDTLAMSPPFIDILRYLLIHLLHVLFSVQTFYIIFYLLSRV